jgi:hypothetical protein
MQIKRFMFASGLALSLGMSAQGADYYVDATASKGGDGSAKAPFATIQAAARADLGSGLCGMRG